MNAKGTSGRLSQVAGRGSRLITVVKQISAQSDLDSSPGQEYHPESGFKVMQSSERKRPAFRFGVFELDAGCGELRKYGVRLKLQDQPLKLLNLLLERPGEIVTREDIQARLWPANTYVDFDNAINSAVRKLREALGDSSDNPRFVETVARRGYRFIAPVSAAGETPYTGAEKPSQMAVSEATILKPRHADSPARKGFAWWLTPLAVLSLILSAFWIFQGHSKRASIPMAEGMSAPRPLTSYPGSQRYPSFSPDGTRVAFSWDDPARHPSGIYVKLIDSGEPVQLTSGDPEDFAPAWSPDGRSIAFLRARGNFEASVMLMPALGGESREITRFRFETPALDDHEWTPAAPLLAWSPDGKWILSLMFRAKDRARQILKISSETGEKQVVTSPPPYAAGDGGLAISPDGRLLAFARSLTAPDSDVYLLHVSADMKPIGDPAILARGGREIEGLAWDASGKEVIFTSSRRGTLELWRKPLAAQLEAVRLPVGADSPMQITISPDGRRLIYSHPFGKFIDLDIWRLNILDKHQDGTNFLSSNRHESRPRYSPDAKHIAFESSRSGNEEVWTCNADGSGCVQLTFFPGAWSGTPHWSPDGQKIAFDSNAHGSWDIYVINSQGGKPRQLTSGPEKAVEPIWSRDGKWIYYCSTKTGDAETWKIPAGGGVPTQVTKGGGCRAFESSDGHSLYFSKDDTLWKMPAEGGTPVKIAESVSLWNYAPVNSGVYFVGVATGSMLKFLDFKTGLVKDIRIVPGRVFDGIGVSNDERWLLYTRLVPGTSELMIIDGFPGSGGSKRTKY